MRVMIVDSDWRFARQATAYLESRAHLVVHETSSTHALTQAKHWKPDLVITSAELAEHKLLASLQKLTDRPAVLLTGRLDRSAGTWRAWQKGGDELLIKPVMRASELQAAVTQAMENASTGTRTRHGRASA